MIHMTHPIQQKSYKKYASCASSCTTIPDSCRYLYTKKFTSSLLIAMIPDFPRKTGLQNYRQARTISISKNKNIFKFCRVLLYINRQETDNVSMSKSNMASTRCDVTLLSVLVPRIWDRSFFSKIELKGKELRKFQSLPICRFLQSITLFNTGK